MSVEITGVIKHSPASKAKIKNGDKLVSVNGHEIEDVLDYMYYTAYDELELVWEHKGQTLSKKVFKSEYDEMLVKVCKACGIYRFVHSLPNGFDTVLSESTTISSGQKQLLTIARAMLQNAPMLILDEATSSVDTRTEAIIQRAMDELTKDRTSFVIAHRLSTIKNADLILVMKDGDVIESGNHTELMAKGGFYAELYNSQFEQTA